MNVRYVLEQDLGIYVFAISFAGNMQMFPCTTPRIARDANHITRQYGRSFFNSNPWQMTIAYRIIPML